MTNKLISLINGFIKEVAGEAGAQGLLHLVGMYRKGGFLGDGPKAEKKDDDGGFFSIKDEQDYNLLLHEIREEDNRATAGQGDRIVEAMDGFYRFLFPTGNIVAWMHEWVFGTRYRMFLTTLPVTPGKPGTPAKPGTRRNPTATPAVPATPARDTRKIFVRWMANIILSARSRPEGYRRLLTVLKTRQVPSGIQLPAGWLNGFGAYVSTVWATAQQWTRTGARTAVDLTNPVNIQMVETAIENGLTTARRGTFRVLGVIAIVLALLVAVATYVNFTGGAL